MGDTADFEQLTAMEARLAKALDRISANLSAVQGAATGADEEARRDAETRAAELEERVNALEARLSETQDALSDALTDAASARAERDAQPGGDAAALAALEARLAAAEAARGAAQAELEERSAELVEKDAALAEMQAALEAAQAEVEAQAEALAEAQARAEAAPPQAAPITPTEGGAEVEDLEKALAVMSRRAERARAERDAARKACDAAKDIADELREATGVTPEDRVLELRRQLRLVRTRAEDLAAQVSLLHSGAGTDVAMLDQGLLAEVEALRQLRETDAAELDRIVSEMQAGLDTAEGGAHA